MMINIVDKAPWRKLKRQYYKGQIYKQQRCVESLLWETANLIVYLIRKGTTILILYSFSQRKPNLSEHGLIFTVKQTVCRKNFLYIWSICHILTPYVALYRIKIKHKNIKIYKRINILRMTIKLNIPHFLNVFMLLFCKWVFTI